MLRSCDRCCATLVLGLSLVVLSPGQVGRGDEKQGKQGEIAEQSFNVSTLVTSTAVANELVELCATLIEPSSWEQAGGAGKIKATRRSLTVTNSTAARDQVRMLVTALSKLPALDEKSAAEAPKTTQVNVATIASPTSKQGSHTEKAIEAKLALFPVADLVWTGEKTPPDFDSLVLLVETCAAPQSWATNSGDGELKSFSARGVLIVRNSPEALTAVDALLAGIRKLPKLAADKKQVDAVATVALGTKLGPQANAEARLYHVADLALAGGTSANFNPIMQRIMDNAATDTWQRNGGDGSLRKLTARGGLVIVNTAAAHQAIEAELAKMRAEQAAEQREKEKAEKGSRRGKGNRE